MYKYIGEYPKDRENGWSDELQGVCHDEENWFFTQKGKMWKFPVSHNLNKKISKSDIDGEKIICMDYGYHLGDIDCFNGYLFVPVVDDGYPYIAVFSAKDLKFITKQIIKRNGNYFDSLGWCAINPTNGKLYTSDRHISDKIEDDKSPIIVYNVDYEAIANRSDKFLSSFCTLIPYTESGENIYLKHSQGGCFDDKNNLHLVNGYPHSYGTRGISIYKVPTMPEYGKKYVIKRISQSEQDGEFRYQFKVSVGEEPEGITYWDLNNIKTKAPEIKGVLHVIMIDNYGTNDDDLYFKHYDRIDKK